VGGWERWDNPARCIRRAAIHIKDRKLAGVHVETVENHKLQLAEELIRRAFDFNSDGTLAPDEAGQARLVLFGQSLGGRAVLYLSRTLKKSGVPVEFAFVIDAYGKDSYSVPSNVRAAANVFQRDHIVVKGASLLHPADPSKTKIILNRRVSYKGRDIDLGDEPKKHRWFMGGHIQLEYDMPLWAEIEEMLVSALKEARARD
jgi:hypothetical protein